MPINCESFTGFHGTIYTIDAWRLPTAEERNSEGPASICFATDIAIAKGYCGAAHGGTEAIARLIPEVDKARNDLVLDLDQIESPRRDLFKRLEAELQSLEADWVGGMTKCIERVYSATISPRNPARRDAVGRKFYHIDGPKDPFYSIAAAARDALAAGHDCLIVENVVDNGSPYMTQSGTTVIVFDPTILSPPALVSEERLTYADIVARVDARKAEHEKQSASR